jgi:hypothetical protein
MVAFSSKSTVFPSKPSYLPTSSLLFPGYTTTMTDTPTIRLATAEGKSSFFSPSSVVH